MKGRTALRKKYYEGFNSSRFAREIAISLRKDAQWGKDVAYVFFFDMNEGKFAFLPHTKCEWNEIFPICYFTTDLFPSDTEIFHYAADALDVLAKEGGLSGEWAQKILEAEDISGFFEILSKAWDLSEKAKDELREALMERKVAETLERSYVKSDISKFLKETNDER